MIKMFKIKEGDTVHRDVISIAAMNHPTTLFGFIISIGINTVYSWRFRIRKPFQVFNEVRKWKYND